MGRENQEQETLASAPNPPLPALPPLPSEAGSYKSRKFILVIYNSMLIVLCGILAAKWTMFAANLPVILGSLMGTMGLYFGANLGQAHIDSKTAQNAQDQ